jgi:flagellar motor protein MotB
MNKSKKTNPETVVFLTGFIQPFISAANLRRAGLILIFSLFAQPANASKAEKQSILTNPGELKTVNPTDTMKVKFQSDKKQNVTQLAKSKGATESAGEQTERAQHEIGEEVISGQSQMTIDDAKIYTTPLIDPFEPLQDLLKSNKYVFDEKLYDDIDRLTIPNQFLHSSYLRIPVEREIITGDVLVFLPKFETSVANWELVVTNSLGETVRRVSKRGNPPALISWDGKTDTGEMLITGEVYNFTFYAYDALGNQTRINGKPQRISGIVYPDKDEWIITIAGEIIFRRGSSEYTDEAKVRVDEAANIVKEKFKKQVVIYVYTENEPLSQARCNILQREISSRIVLPKEALAVVPRFIPGLQPKYSKIEIHIR